MNKIKFGISVNKVGAITVWNYRLRMKKKSELQLELWELAHSWHARNVHIDIVDSTQDCVRYDFSSTCKKDFEMMVIEIEIVRAEVEIRAVKQKWQHLFDVSYETHNDWTITVDDELEIEPEI